MASVPFTIGELFSVATRERVYAKALQIATALGLPVTTWRAGDPTRSLYHLIAELVSGRDEVSAAYARSAFLDSATGVWLKIKAKQDYNIDYEPATAAASSVRLKNTGGGVFLWDASDITFRSSVTGKTYRNTAAGSLTLVDQEVDVAFIADEEGADSALAADELDEIVTAMPGVEIVSSEPAVARDEESDEALRARCRASTGALSPNGPADVYRFIALSSAITGNTETNRVYVSANSGTGVVGVYLAGAAGAVSSGAIAAVADAFDTYATPLCITVDVQSATTVTQDVTVTVTLRASSGASSVEAAARVKEAIESALRAYPIGGVAGVLNTDAVRGAVFSEFGAYVVDVDITTPSSDVALAPDEVIVPGSVHVTANIVAGY